MPSVNRLDPIPYGSTARYIPARGLKIPQSIGLMCVPWILKEAKAYRPDIIRDHSPYTFGLASLVSRSILDVPVVGSFLHPETGRHGRWVERRLLQHYSHVTTISQASFNQLVEQSPPLEAMTSVIYPGVSPEYGPNSPSDKREWLRIKNLDGCEPIFCTAGSLVSRKNHTFLIDVFKQWSQAGRPGSMIITGTGPLETELTRKVQEQGLTDRVLFWGYISPLDYVALLNASTAFLFPSLMEGFGLAPAEAMACGTTAIVSDRGSLSEVVRHGTTGFVLPVDHGPGPWLEAMSKLCDNPGLRFQMSQAAMADVRTRFSWDRTGQETADLYQHIVQRYAKMT